MPAGYEGRLLLWAIRQRPRTPNELALLACPIVLALDEVLGGDQVIGLDIWALRADTTHQVSAAAARGQITNLNTLVRRLTT